MPANVQVILIPYDSGHRNLRMGSGPEHFLDNGLVQTLKAVGHEASVVTVESQSQFQAEVQTQFELYRYAAEQVAIARQNGSFPLILSGNCGATLAAIAGAETTRLGVVWFDAHGEFNTPETTTSGFLDGMGLAVATGLCWQRLAASVPNFRPLPASNILLIGGRDFDGGEQESLEQTGVTVLDYARVEKWGMQHALQKLRGNFWSHIKEVHLHVDLDVLNPQEARANGYATGERGISTAQLADAIESVRAYSKIASATIASFDPRYDSDDKVLQAGLRLISQIIPKNK